MIDKLQYKAYWSHIVADIRTYILGCLTYAKWANATRSQLLSPINVSQVFDFLGMDFIGPFKVSSAEFKFILNVVNYFCRYMIPTLTVSNKINDAIQTLSEIFQILTTPGAFYLDRGSHFDNQNLRDFLSSRNVVVVFALSSSHQSM